jgi:hypothetical protein
MSMLNDCYKNAAAINAKGQPFPAEPLLMALLLLSQHKMIDWLTKQISKYESLVDNNKEVRNPKNKTWAVKIQMITSERMDERIHYIDDY